MSGFTPYIIEQDQPGELPRLYLKADDTWTGVAEQAEEHYSLGRARWKGMCNKGTAIVADYGKETERRLPVEHDEVEPS